MLNHARSAILVGVIVALAPVTTVEAQTTTTVELQGGNIFSPANITISVGDTVHWVWIAGSHNVESGVVVGGSGVHDNVFRSGNPTAVGGTTWDLTFTQAFLDANPVTGNVYQYYCDPHAGVGMVGTVTVQAAGSCSSNDDCDDNNACNGAETCTNNACATSTALDCDDQKPCTDDSCDTASGCLNVANNSNSCDDGNACTENDMCSASFCSGTAIAGCGDSSTNDGTGGTTDGSGTTDGTGTTDGSGTSDSGSTTTSPCGAAGMIIFLGMFLGLGLMRFSRRG